MSAGKLAAQLSHCVELYWLHMIKQNSNALFVNGYPTRHWVSKESILYRNDDLYNLAKEALNNDQDIFFAGKEDEGDEFSKIVKQDPIEKVYTEFEVPIDIWNDYINGSIRKIVLQAKNLNQLLKAKDYAEKLGLVEYEDFGFVNDRCFTELVPENDDGTTTTAFWTKPLSDDEAHEISKHYHLYIDETKE